MLLLALDAEPGAETATAIHHRKIGVVKERRARMFDLGRAPARPRQSVVVAFVRTGRGALSEHVEVGLMRHVRLEPLRRLTAVAGRETAAVHFAQNILGDRQIVLDLDVLEHLIGEAELLGHQVDDFKIVLRFEDRLDDLLAPLQCSVRGDARAAAFELRGDRQEIHVVLAAGLHGERSPGRGVRIADDQKFNRLKTFQGFRHAGDAVAGMPLDEHRFHIVFLGDLVLRQKHGIEPAGQRDPGRLHDFLVVEAAEQVVVVDLPDPRPMLPGGLGQPVVERQRHDIEADVGGALHIVMTAEDVCASARCRRHCR